MKRAVHTLALVGLVPVLTSNALGGTHTVTTKKAGIIKLRSSDGSGQCSGSIVGVRPLTVLTAFHCLSDMLKGDIVAVIENEAPEIKKAPRNYLSTRVVSSKKLKETSEYYAIERSHKKLTDLATELSFAEADLKKAPSSIVLQERVKTLRETGMSYYHLYQRAFDKLKEKAAFAGSSLDLAVVSFDNYKGPLNTTSTKELIELGAIVPVSPNNSLVGKKVAFGGFGAKGLGEEAASELGAFNNVIKKQVGGLLATFGMLPGVHDSQIPKGQMGAILPGDSGGPLMNDYGVVGVASYIKPSPMETENEPAPGWPVDQDGFYSYLTGRFVDLSDEASLEVLETARNKHQMSIEVNGALNLALTDIKQWNKLRPAPKLPQPLEPSAPHVLAGLALISN